MKYKAIVSFSGFNLSMREGEVREISDQSLVDDLLRANYIIPFEADVVEEPSEEEPSKKKVEKKTSTKGKGKKQNEN